MQLPTQDLELALQNQGLLHIAGCDEAGRGAWAGPLVAAAVILPAGTEIKGLRDSKLLSEPQRERLFDVIRNVATAWNVAVFPVEQITERGLQWVNMEALRQSVQGLKERPQHVLVDGFFIPELGFAQTRVIHGDATVLAIAAASVLAKVTRDRMMRDLDKQFPQYRFGTHKGYGTAEHSKQLEQYGVSPVHRTTFRPIQALLAAQNTV